MGKLWYSDQETMRHLFSMEFERMGTRVDDRRPCIMCGVVIVFFVITGISTGMAFMKWSIGGEQNRDTRWSMWRGLFGNWVETDDRMHILWLTETKTTWGSQTQQSLLEFSHLNLQSEPNALR
jgi:hypothetical protein